MEILQFNRMRVAFSAVAFSMMLAAPAAVTAQDAPASHMVVNLDTPGPVINRHIYGHFAEHLGHGIYGGFWVEDGAGGWRLNKPVVEALRKIKPANVRWPGGCFADVYHWKDGVGPRAERPTIVNTLWGGVTENNSFGTHEFMELVTALDSEPIVVGNVGSGTVKEMSDWWEYLNHPGPSPMADLRAKNGRAEPWNVRFFGVGNESWGCGGNMDAEYYADVYKRFATYLHRYGDLQPFRVATGPYHSEEMMKWTEVMMRDAGHMIDGLDLHYYTVVGTWQEKGSAVDFEEADWIQGIRKGLVIDEAIKAQAAIMDRYDPEKRVWLIVGEWGMWHDVEPGTNPGFLRQQSTLRDAMVAALSLNAFNRHADRVKMANIAQTVNVLQAMILTQGDELIVTPTYHVFEMFKGHQDATLLPVVLDEGAYNYGETTIPALNASASINDEGRVLVTIANFDPHSGRTVEVSLRGGTLSQVSGRILTADAMTAHNTFDDPDNVAPAPFGGASLMDDHLVVKLPPKALVALELE
ncbi:MAG TPA: alpha-L-arabinofuranosidase C-terminal domain-containing protein [Rhodothermales bacterium]|nr:alpha-L-arabinofuranosidase C-terminal domain-containing protein [Rhodothermales bacterium]